MVKRVLKHTDRTVNRQWEALGFMVSTSKDIPDYINTILKERKITQYKLAQEMGIPAITISRWRRGKYLPRGNNLLWIKSMYDELMQQKEGE